jgi:hypothetical protein
MQGHASTILKRDDLTDRKALGTRVGDELRPQIADGTHAYDATRFDTRQILMRFNSARVRAPTTFHIGHLLVCSAANREQLH